LGGTILNSLKRKIVFSGNHVVDSRMLITRDRVDDMKASDANIIEFKRCLYTVVEDSDEIITCFRILQKFKKHSLR
jgi:hypothetical protein